jgi:hypothetical protein
MTPSSVFQLNDARFLAQSHRCVGRRST